jgi:hypothetical protein
MPVDGHAAALIFSATLRITAIFLPAGSVQLAWSRGFTPFEQA